MQGGKAEIIYIDESTKMPDFDKINPKLKRALLYGEWAGENTGEIELRNVDPISPETQDSLTIPAKRMTREAIEEMYGRKGKHKKISRDHSRPSS